MDCEKNPFLDMSKDQIQKIEAVLQSEQAKALLQESSHVVQLFENTSEKESLDITSTAEEEHLPILDETLEAGLNDLEHVFEQNSSQVLFSGATSDDVELTTELLHDDFNEQTMELDVILMDHCYTVFPEDLLKSLQLKQTKNENSSEEINFHLKKDAQHRSSIASLRRSQRQLDKYQREQVEKIKAENAELQRREKEEIERRRAQTGNDQQKENLAVEKNVNVSFNEEISDKKENDETSHEKITSDVLSPSIKDKNARKSIQQKKLSGCDNDNNKSSDNNNANDIPPLNPTDENQKEEIIENIVADIDEMGKQAQDKKSFVKKKKKQCPSDSNSKTHKKAHNIKVKKSSPVKPKHCKGDSLERSQKYSSDNKFKETKNNKECLSDIKEEKFNLKINKDDTKLSMIAKKVIKKVHNRRESNISLADEPALFSQPDVMVKRKASVEEGDNKKDKASDDNEEAKTNFLDNIDTKTKFSEIKKEMITTTEENKKFIRDDTETGIEENYKLLSNYLLNDAIDESQMLLPSSDKVEQLDFLSPVVHSIEHVESNLSSTIETSKPKMKVDREIGKENENKKILIKHSDQNEKEYKQLYQQIPGENKKDVDEFLQQKEKAQQEISQEKMIMTNIPLKEKMQKQSSQEKMLSDIVKIENDDEYQREKQETSTQQRKIQENKKIVNNISFLKEKAQKLNNQDKAIQESKKSIGEKSQWKEKGQKETNYRKVSHELKKIHHTGSSEMTVKKFNSLEVKDEQEGKISHSSQNKIPCDIKFNVQEKKHYTRYSIGKIKGNKYIKMLTGKGFSEDLENQTEEDDPEKLWCICRQPYDERFMIQCDNCEDWFHGNCVGVTQQQGRQLERSKQEWWCPNCLEGMTEDPVQAINSGDLALMVAKTSVPKQTKERNKSEKINTNITPSHRTPNNLVASKANISIKKEIKDNATSESTKSTSVQHSDTKNESKPNSSPLKKDVNRPEPVRMNVRNTLKGILTSRCNDANDVDVAENDIKCIAGYIEEELYKLFKDTGSKYKSKYRSLMFNIKDPRNQGLYRKIVKGIITPEQLVKMTPEELASTELAKWRERESKHMLEMIKREQIEQQQAALTQVIKKTHKGEVEVDEDSKIPEQKSLKQLPEEAPELIMDTTDKHRSHLFDLNCKICTGKMAPPKEDKSVKKVRIAHAISKEDQSDQEQVSITSKNESKILDEADMDDIADQEVSSTLRSPDSTVTSYFTSIAQTTKNAFSVWKGFIAMQDIAKFVTAAYNVSGATDTLEQDIPDSIQVCGRIVPDQVWDYLTKIKQSVNKDIIIIRFAPANDEEKTPYGTLYSYLNSRKRYGVVGNCSRMIKDFYIMPLASYTPVPTVLMPFKGPGLDSARPHLLLGVIVRHTSKSRQSSNQSRKTSKMPERSYTPPLETMPSSSDESMSQASTKSSLKRTPRSDEYEPYEPSFTPPLEKMPKVDSDDTSQNRDFYEDKPYDPEDDNFVTGVSQSMKSVTSKVLNDTNSSDSLEHEKRLLIELTKKVEEEKQQIEKSLKLTNTTLTGKTQLPSPSPISQKYKLESETELPTAAAEVNTFQIPGLGDGWQLSSELNTTANFVSSEETNPLHVSNNLNKMMCNENLQNSTRRENMDMKCSEISTDFPAGTTTKSSSEVQQDNLSNEPVIDSQMIEQSQQEDHRSKLNDNTYVATSKSTSKSSLSSMSASELWLKAQEQLEEMENAQKLQNAQSNYWTAVQHQTSIQSNVINPEPLDLPSYSSNSFSQNISEHYLPHTENHSEHYTSTTTESHPRHYSSHSEPHSFHYEEHSNNHNQRYYSRENRSSWNQQGSNSGRYHRYRRKYWTPMSSHHHHKHKGWYHRHDGDRH